jgi:chemotaxis protein methyltransferase CheR
MTAGAFLTDVDFDMIRNLLRERSAIVLDDGKRYLVEARLTPLVRELKLNSIGELIAQLRVQSGNGLQQQIVEAMVTTETSFFRDHHPFEDLRKTIFPRLLEQRRGERSLSIWCAASSTGQEPYSIAILLRENFPELASWKIRLLATDLSREAVERARAGRFKQIEVERGLPAALLVKYFVQHGTEWELRDDIRSQVEFQLLHLAGPWPRLPSMDLVLLRNVMIYFEVETKKAILDRLQRVLSPDGYLLLGGAETTFSLSDSYRRVDSLKSSFYQLLR